MRSIRLTALVRIPASFAAGRLIPSHPSAEPTAAAAQPDLTALSEQVQALSNQIARQPRPSCPRATGSAPREEARAEASEPAPNEEGAPVADPEGPSDEQQRAFDEAGTLVENAIHAGRWDMQRALQLRTILANARPEGQHAIRLQIVQAINRGELTLEDPMAL